jgi:hypothetical protein
LKVRTMERTEPTVIEIGARIRAAIGLDRFGMDSKESSACNGKMVTPGF